MQARFDTKDIAGFQAVQKPVGRLGVVESINYVCIHNGLEASAKRQ